MANLEHLSIYNITKDNVSYDALFMKYSKIKSKWLILPVDIKKLEKVDEFDECSIRYCNNSNDPSETCFIAKFNSLDVDEINQEYNVVISDSSKGKIAVNNSYDAKGRFKNIKFAYLKENKIYDRRLYNKTLNFYDGMKHSINRKKIDIILKKLILILKQKKEQYLLRKKLV